MIRLSLHCLRLITGLAILLLTFCSILFIVTIPDRFTEVEAQGLYTEHTFDEFLQRAHRDLAIMGGEVVAVLALLVFLFIKATRSLRKLK